MNSNNIYNAKLLNLTDNIGYHLIGEHEGDLIRLFMNRAAAAPKVAVNVADNLTAAATYMAVTADLLAALEFYGAAERIPHVMASIKAGDVLLLNVQQWGVSE